jgi:ketosteroid isomerase-like protein
MHLVSSMRSGMKADEAFNKNDATAVAPLFTEDAVLVASDGMFYGSAGHRERVCRHIPAVAYYHL